MHFYQFFYKYLVNNHVSRAFLPDFFKKTGKNAYFMLDILKIPAKMHVFYQTFLKIQ